MVMNVVATGLCKIGKNALPAGLIGIFRCPQMQRHGAGGNDQLQKGCKLAGGARGLAATAANSSYVTPAFVAATQTGPAGSITWECKSEQDIAKQAAAMLQPSEPALRYMYYIPFYVIWTYDLPGGSNASLPGLDLEGHLSCSYKKSFDGMAGAKPNTPQLFQTGLFLLRFIAR